MRRYFIRFKTITRLFIYSPSSRGGTTRCDMLLYIIYILCIHVRTDTWRKRINLMYRQRFNYIQIYRTTDTPIMKLILLLFAVHIFFRAKKSCCSAFCTNTPTTVWREDTLRHSRYSVIEVYA